jgi:hypothetical protein
MSVVLTLVLTCQHLTFPAKATTGSTLGNIYANTHVPVHSKVSSAINQLLTNQAAFYPQMAALTFHAPPQRNSMFQAPLFIPLQSQAFPHLLQLEVSHQAGARVAVDVVNAVMDAVDAGVHHLGIIWLAVGVGGSLAVPAVVFHLFNKGVHSSQTQNQVILN